MDSAAAVAHPNYLIPSTYKWSNIHRVETAMADLAALTSGSMRLVGVPLPPGATIAKVALMSGATALSGGNNQWAVLLDSSFRQLAISPDATSGAWAANTVKSFTFSASALLSKGGLYFVGLVVNATTPPSLVGISDYASAVSALAPVIEGTSTTGLTTPASFTSPATAPTATGLKPWVLLG